MRVLSAVGATVVVATLAATASAQTCNFETCMGKTCDYWDYAYSCDTLEDAAECDCAGYVRPPCTACGFACCFVATSCLQLVDFAVATG